MKQRRGEGGLRLSFREELRRVYWRTDPRGLITDDTVIGFRLYGLGYRAFMVQV